MTTFKTADELAKDAERKLAARFWFGRLSDMVRFACRDSKVLAGCSMPVPCKGRFLRLPSSWPLRSAVVETEDGRRFRLSHSKGMFSVDA
jgi:hypothetical protein